LAQAKDRSVGVKGEVYKILIGLHPVSDFEFPLLRVSGKKSLELKTSSKQQLAKRQIYAQILFFEYQSIY